MKSILDIIADSDEHRGTMKTAAGLDHFVGSKGGAGVAEQIISQMPPHTVYIEPFVGTGAVLRKKRAAPVSIAIDRDPVAIHRLWESVAPHSTNGDVRLVNGVN